MLTIDLNCDLGEGGVADAALMPLITSANIACGGHAGNDATMATTVRLARQHGVVLPEELRPLLLDPGKEEAMSER